MNPFNSIDVTAETDKRRGQSRLEQDRMTYNSTDRENRMRGDSQEDNNREGQVLD